LSGSIVFARLFSKGIARGKFLLSIPLSGTKSSKIKDPEEGKEYPAAKFKN